MTASSHLTFQGLSATQAYVLGKDGNLWLESAPWGHVPPSREQVDASVSLGGTSPPAPPPAEEAQADAEVAAVVKAVPAEEECRRAGRALGRGARVRLGGAVVRRAGCVHRLERRAAMRAADPRREQPAVLRAAWQRRRRSRCGLSRW